MDARVEGLDPSIEHLREPGHGRDVGHRQPGVAQGAGRPAGRHELEPEPRPARPRTGRARSCPTRTAAPVAGAGTAASATLEIHRRRAGHPPRRRPRRRAAGRRPAAGSRCSTAWIRVGRVASSSPGRIVDRLLGDDRAAIERRVDEVDRAAGHPRRRAPGRRATACAARERRQQRRMRVEDPARERRQHGRARRSACSRRGRSTSGPTASSVSARVASSPPGTSAVSIPCSAAQSSAGQARSAKTRTIVAAQLAPRSPPPGSRAGSTRPPTRRPRSARSSRHGLQRRLRRSAAAASDAPASTTSPITRRRRCPWAANDSIAAATAAGWTTAIIPIPPLNVDRSSTSSRPPSAPNRRMTDGIAQRVGSRRAARSAGSARGTLPGQAAAGDVGQSAEVVAGGVERRADRQDRPARRSGSGSAGPRRASPSPSCGSPASASVAGASPSVRRSRSWYGSARSRSHDVSSDRTSE